MKQDTDSEPILGSSMTMPPQGNLYNSMQNYEPTSLVEVPAYKSSPKSAVSIKQDWFSDVVAKVMDKLLSALPVVVKKLIEFFLGQVTNLGYGYNDSYGYVNSDIQSLVSNLGIFGLVPVILVRLLHGLGAFINILRKNKFLKDFLIPALVVGLVAGSVIFLIWWLQPDAYGSDYGGSNGYGYATGGVTDATYSQGDGYQTSYVGPYGTRMNQPMEDGSSSNLLSASKDIINAPSLIEEPYGMRMAPIQFDDNSLVEKNEIQTNVVPLSRHSLSESTAVHYGAQETSEPGINRPSPNFLNVRNSMPVHKHNSTVQ